MSVVVASTVLLAVSGVVAMGIFAPVVRPAAARVAPPPSESDHCYVESMLMHHAQALELSERVLDADGVSKRVRALAEFIVADQTAEMTTMTAWSEAWRNAPDATAAAERAASGGHEGHAAAATVPAATACTRDVHASMSGMATPEQLRALVDAEGTAAQRLFLELMIVHHDGALVMAESALVEGANAFVRSSAKHVVVEQQREIEAMTALLRETP